MRINQYLAYCLGIGRRTAEEPILKNEVKINGEIVNALHTQVGQNDVVELKTRTGWVKVESKTSQTILFYKPNFCVSTKFDPDKRRTIYDLLPKKYHNLKNAGRLDFMSEGILVLSTDGNILQRLTHPKFGHTKTYFVALNKPFSAKDIELMASGKIELNDHILNPMVVSALTQKEFENYNYLKLSPKLYWYNFALTEGRNLQIRRVCQMLGSGVTRLIRITQGEYQMSRELAENKIIEL